MKPKSIIMLALPKGTPIARSKRKIRSKRQDKAKEAIQRIFDIGNDKDVMGTSTNSPFVVNGIITYRKEV